MVFRERAVVEGLINIRRGASSDRLSVGGFGGGGLYHGGIEREDFRLGLRRSWDALVAQTIFQTRAFFFSRVAIAEGVAGTWVAGPRLRGMCCGGHCWSVSSGSVA